MFCQIDIALLAYELQEIANSRETIILSGHFDASSDSTSSLSSVAFDKHLDYAFRFLKFTLYVLITSERH